MAENGKSPEAPKTVSAQAFVLVDESGNERAHLRLGADGNPSLGLQDRAGVTRVQVRLAEDGSPGIALNASDGDARLILTLGDHDTPRIWLYDRESDAPRVGLLLDREGTAAIDLWGSGRESAITIFAHRDGEVSLGFWHKDEPTPRIGFRVAGDGEALAGIYDQNGKAGWRVEPAADSPQTQREGRERAISRKSKRPRRAKDAKMKKKG